MRLIVCHFLLLSIIVTRTFCKECPPITSKNVDQDCEQPRGGSFSCEYPVDPETNARLRCKPLFEYSSAVPDPPYRVITCLDNGTWHPPPFDCVPECGIVTLSGYRQIVSGRRTGFGAFPWHVGVYHVDWITGQFEHICGGSLISPELVISAAHCFYDETKNRLQDARDYAVAAGKLIRSYYQSEINQQKSPIQRIYVPDGYRGLRQNSSHDIAILRLDKSFDITSFVMPVCVDFSNTYTEDQLNRRRIGKVMGWGVNKRRYPHEDLQEIDLPYIDRNTCKEGARQNFRPLLTDDKICAGYLNGSRTSYGDSGGGLCFRSESNARWYLRGIDSVGDSNHSYYTAFTNVANHTDWIESVMTDARNIYGGENSKIDIVRSCIPPEPPTGGYFEHESCAGSCNYVPGITFPMGSVLEYNCGKGYSLRGNSTSICQNAVWSPPPACIKLKYCPPIPPSDNLEAVCQHDNRIVSCELDVVPGTIAALQCADKYRMNFNGDNSRLIQFICSANGTWNTDPASEHCTRSECGIAPVIDNFTHLVNGTKIHAGDIPWPVFTYRQLDKNTKSWCFATLVKPDLVITGTDCEKPHGINGTRQYIEELRVVDTFDGLLHADFISNRSYHQEHSVKNYRVHESYHNSPDDLNNIIALRLQTPFIPKRYVSPLCIDWSLELDLPRAGEFGMVVHFVKAKLIRYATHVIDNKECNRLLDANNKRQITHNEFCIEVPKDAVHYVHFAVRRNGIWYLAGFSISHFVDEKQSRRLKIMTKIGYHMDWMKQVGEDL